MLGQAVPYLTGYPLLKVFFPYKGVQCFSWESWPQYKVDEVTFIFKTAESAFEGKTLLNVMTQDNKMKKWGLYKSSVSVKDKWAEKNRE